MKIVYWGNVKNTPHPTVDQEILKALKEVAEVKLFDIKDLNVKKLVDEANQSDLFLFHGQVPTSDETISLLIMEQIQLVLRSITCKKVLWFMEKVWLAKGGVVERLIPAVDYAFFSDETWVRRMKETIYSLHPASSIKPLKGKYRTELACDIAYVGTIYGVRGREYEFLKENYGDGVKFFENKFGQDLADLCKSAKIMVIPRFPFDDFFWSDRIYTYLSYGAFVVQQRTYGLKEEGFEDGKHYFDYEKDEDFTALLNSVLAKGNEGMRKSIAKKGQEFVKGITYRERVKRIIDKCNEIKG